MKDAYPNDKLTFRVVTLLEPPKNQIIPFLDAEHSGKANVRAPRRAALIQFYKGPATDFREVHLDLDTGSILKEKKLEGKHSYVDSTEMGAAEAACLASPEVQDAIKMLQLPERAIVCIEPWTYGTDGMNDMTERIIMVFAIL